MSARRRSMLLLRRQSVSSPAAVALAHVHAQNHHHNASPIDNKSVKNAGEGVLSDSDSDVSPESDVGDDGDGDNDNDDDSDDGDDDDEGAGTVGVADSSDEERQLGVVTTVPHTTVTTPSPLSRLPEQPRWTGIDEDEEDEEEGASSPSPGSTETESEGGGEVGESGEKNPMSVSMQRRPSLSNKPRRNSKTKTRSRSSTLASLPAGPPPRLSSSTRYQSQSSIRTITPAAETSFQTSSDHPTPIEAVGREPSSRSRGKYGINRERHEEQQQFEEVVSVKAIKTTARRADIVVEEEKQILEYCWEILRESFEEFVLSVSFLFGFEYSFEGVRLIGGWVCKGGCTDGCHYGSYCSGRTEAFPPTTTARL